MNFDARKTALEILNILDQGRETLDSVMAAYDGDESDAFKADRRLLQALVYGVLRWRGRLDHIISHFSTTALKKIDPTVLNILRLALFQIIYLNRIPDSAAVNTAVEMAKSGAAPWVVRYVNAVLRKAARDHHAIPFPDVETDTIKALAVGQSFPDWLIRKWADRYGIEGTAALCDAVNSIPPITVRTNTLKITRQELTEALEPEVDQPKPTSHSPDGVSFSNPKKSIPNLSAFKAGWFQVQDEAAQLVSMFLNPKAGERILDACAGLGGKTGHIAQLMGNKGDIRAVDIDSRKLLRLEDEMQRLGIAIVSTHPHNLEQPFTTRAMAAFDRILLDAPCSGLGVLRRNPDIKWLASRKHLNHYKLKQLRLLEQVSRLIKPTGVLVYAVCSLEPEENEAVVNEFLKKHAEFVIDKRVGKLPETCRDMLDPRGFFRTWPYLVEMDGFFAVRLRLKS